MYTSSPPRGRRGRGAVAAAAIAILLFGVVPAAAQTEAGAGTFALDETVLNPGPTQIPPPFFCSEVLAGATYETNSTLSQDLTQGTYTATNDNVVYDGPLVFTMIATDNYFVTPEGTYYGQTAVPNPKDPCGPDNFGALAPVPADFTVFDPGNVHLPADANAPCEGTGSFYRVNTTFYAEWTLSSDCQVVSNAGVAGAAPAGTLHTMEGNQQPCPCTGPAIVGTYEQTLH